MPIFDVKRCRDWFAKNCREFGHATADSLARELGEALESVAPTPQCIAVPALIGATATDDVDHPRTCWFC